MSDEFGRSISSTSAALNANSEGSASVTFTAPSQAYGYYRVDATLTDGTTVSELGTRPAGFVSYAVVPDPSNRVNYGDAGSRFGMQGGFNGAQGNVMQILGTRYLLDGPGWRGLEPNYSGQFAAARSAAKAKGQNYPSPVAHNSAAWATYGVPLVTVASVPSWAMEPGSGTQSWPNMGILTTAGEEGLTAFAKEYAGAVATNYAGQTSHYYQMTWEPVIPQGFKGTPAQLVQFYKSSYAAIHAADPKAVVMGPTLFADSKALISNLWSAGLGQYLDAVSMHPYTTFPPEAANLVSNVRTQMQMAQAATGKNVPFVGTEHGLQSGTVGELNEALGNIRTTLILLGEGFKFDFAFYIADFWTKDPTDNTGTYGYYWNLDPNINYGTDKIGPKPAVPAFSAMTYLLDGSTSSGTVSNLSGTQIGYRFERDGTTVLALWDYQSSSTVTLPISAATVKVCNWMGTCTTTAVSGKKLTVNLGSSPIYILGDNI